MPFDFITFDCYGTLIDWESGIADAFASLAAEEGLAFSRQAIGSAYAAAEPLVQRERYRSYRDVLTESAMRAALLLGWSLAADRAGFLAASLPSWPPFSDTNAALERLRAAGLRLGILSNIDDDLLAETRRHFTVDFDLIITAQQLRSYKPALAHFTTARSRIGNLRWLHAAESNFHDIIPTNILGIPNAWINRDRQQARPGGTPTYELTDLRGLADLLT